MQYEVRREGFFWRCVSKIERFDADINEYIKHYGKERGERIFHLENFDPYPQIVEGNIGANAGIQLLEDLLIGVGTPTKFDSTNAAIGVGTSTTAAAATDTNLLGTRLRKGMDATFPSRAAQTMSWKASFGTSEANFTWAEWGVFNAVTDATGTMLNRKVESLGGKVTGTWTLQVDVGIS